MSPTNEELEWLIRDASLVIRGPISQIEIVAMIKKGLLKGKIEISKCNAYWFSIDEKAEVAKFLPELAPASSSESHPDPTQMTETITHAGMFDADHESSVEITQFTNMPTRADLLKANKQEMAQANSEPSTAPQVDIQKSAPTGATPTKSNPPVAKKKESKNSNEPAPGKNESSGHAMDQMEWLDPAVADEFGLQVEGESLSIDDDMERDQTDQTAVTEKAISNELLKRATVKADTLPSEMKDSTTPRPLPINSIIKSKPTTQQPTSPVSPNYINVAISPSDMGAKIIQVEDEAAENAGKKSTYIILTGILIALSVLGFATYQFLAKARSAKVLLPPKIDLSMPALDGLKKALFLFDLDQAEKYSKKLTEDSSAEADMVRAVYKKELLFNAEGALADLTRAKGKSSGGPLRAEIENLIGVYSFEADPLLSLSTLKALAENRNGQDVHHYNYALALGRAKKYQESLAALGSFSSKSIDAELMNDMRVLSGWMKYLLTEGSDKSVFSDFEDALDENPFSGTARLGLAIAKLRADGAKEADREFKTFIESVPDLDEPSQVPFFRQMRASQLYDFAREEIRQLNVPGGNVGAKPSAIIMAVDAIISCIQNRTGEAKKIIETALASSPGDPFLLKAQAYQRWKEGKYEEVLETFKESSKEKVSFSTLLLISKSLMKAGRSGQAEPYVKQILNLAPERSEGLTLRGDILVASGNAEAAIAYYKSALSKNPADLHALKGLSQLEETWPKYFKRISHYFPN